MLNGSVFQTERLRVRRWVPTDEARILALYSHTAVTTWVDDGEPLSAEDAHQWMGVTERNYAARGYGMFAIEARTDGATLGFGGLVHPGGQELPEAKYAFLPAAWGRGFATEFVRGLISYGRTAHGLKHITATVHPDNAASARVLLKSGMEDATRFADGTDVPTRLFEIHLQ